TESDATKNSPAESPASGGGRFAGLDRRERAQLRNQLYSRFRELENEIERVEARLAEIHALQADPDAYANGIVTPELSAEAAELDNQLPVFMSEWEEIG